VARTAGQDAEHVLQAQRRQLERPLVAGAQDVERRRAVGHGRGAAVAHVPPDDLRGERTAAQALINCARAPVVLARPRLVYKPWPAS